MCRDVRIAVWVLVGMACTGAVWAIEYHDHFIGFSSEVSVSGDRAVTPFVPDALAVESVSFMTTFGPQGIRPIRFRGGIGWFPSRPLRLVSGVEVPIFELLNRAMARFFGVYLLADVAMLVPVDWHAEAMLTVLVPASALGGIRFGFGINRRLDFVFSASWANGAYPIRTGT